MPSTSFMMLLCLQSGWLVQAAGAQAEGATPSAPTPRKAMARKVGGHSQKSSVEVQADGLAVASKRNQQMAREATSTHASLAEGTQAKSGGKVDNSHVHQRAAENATAVQFPNQGPAMPEACQQAIEAVPECANLTLVQRCFTHDASLCAALMAVPPAPCRHPEIEQNCAVADPFDGMHRAKIAIACIKEMGTVPACAEKVQVWHATCSDKDPFAEDLSEECKIFRNRPAECRTEEINMACAAAKKFLDFAEGCVAAMRAEPACADDPEHEACVGKPHTPPCPAPCVTEDIKAVCGEDTFAEMSSAQSYSMALAPLLVYFLS